MNRKELMVLTQDPLVAAVKKAYRGSTTAQVEELLEARRKWQRRVTIATNKLAEADAALRSFAFQAAQKLDGVKIESKEKE